MLALRSMAAFGVLALFLGSAQAETLKMGNEGDYPPFSITQPDGTLSGLEPTLARALCKKLGAECDIQPMEFKSLIPALATGKIDMIVSQIFPTPEREKAVDLTIPVLENPEIWITKAGANATVTPETLKGKSIGIIKGAWNVELVKNYAPDATLNQYDNISAIRLDLEAGRIDIASAGKLAALRGFIDAKDGKDWQLVEPVKELIGAGTFSWAVQKGNTELRERVNKALGELYADCTYTNIRKDFFSLPTSSQEPASCK